MKVTPSGSKIRPRKQNALEIDGSTVRGVLPSVRQLHHDEAVNTPRTLICYQRACIIEIPYISYVKPHVRFPQLTSVQRIRQKSVTLCNIS
jgi:hypothetical protein